ncbi:MAG: DUF1385 domain-containing protein [Clostridiales bacterium]|nr:DUF1385 domain-containing protein [Clostridiales bacterium]
MTEIKKTDDADLKSDPGKETQLFRSNGKRTTIGGQALIEGLIMFGPGKTALAVRKADGSIYSEDVHRGKTGGAADRIPIVRGCVRFFRQIVTGMSALMRSADLSEMGGETEIESAKRKTPESELEHSKSATAENTSPENLGAENRSSETANSETLTAENIIAETAVSETVSTEKKIEGNVSAEIEPEKKSRMDAFLERHEKGAMTVTAALSILFSIAIFILLPRWIVDVGVHFFRDDVGGTVGSQLLINLAEGIVRIAILIGYLALTSRMKEIARVWMYHGAEHKTIRCYEAGEPLTVENIRKYSTRHPRCGTAFLLIVVLVSILTFSIIGALLKGYIGENIWWLNSLIRLALVPLVGGISYEILRLTGRYDHTVIGRILTKPGMWLQRFTTREPDDSMLEVAIVALEAVLPEKKEEDNW